MAYIIVRMCPIIAGQLVHSVNCQLAMESLMGSQWIQYTYMPILSSPFTQVMDFEQSRSNLVLDTNSPTITTVQAQQRLVTCRVNIFWLLNPVRSCRFLAKCTSVRCSSLYLSYTCIYTIYTIYTISISSYS